MSTACCYLIHSNVTAWLKWPIRKVHIHACSIALLFQQAAALCVKAATDLLVCFFVVILHVWRRSVVKVIVRADQEVTVTLMLKRGSGEKEARHCWAFACGQPRLHGSNGTRQSRLGRTDAHDEARCGDERRRHATDQVNVASLFLVKL